MSVVSDPIEDPRRALRAARLGEFRVFVRRFLRNPLGVVGFAIVVLLVLVAIFAPLLATHDPYLPSLGKRLSAPSAEFWFGADELGRDIYSRLVYGSRLTLFIVGLVIVTSAPIGLIIGAVAFVAALGPGIVNAALAITLTAWPPYARLARAEAMVVRNSDYVAAARLAGASPFRIIVFHVIPMCLSSVIVRVTFDMAGIILTAAGLGFIGLGAQPPLPEWGAMISTGRRFIFDQWWVPTIPGIAIFVVSLGFNLLGDAVRDLLDPHLRQRR